MHDEIRYFFTSKQTKMGLATGLRPDPGKGEKFEPPLGILRTPMITYYICNILASLYEQLNG